jgi:trans-aconitate 2-methyltransferase
MIFQIAGEQINWTIQWKNRRLKGADAARMEKARGIHEERVRRREEQMAWSAGQYLKFEDERTRPARDLLQAVPAGEVRRAADLGCGPGNSTELIAARYPEAFVVGVDNAPDMIRAAKERLPAVQFELATIEEWSAEGPWDLIFANAALQWVPGHETVLPKLARMVSKGGSLAIQMPDNMGEPSHTAMEVVAAEPAFAAKLAGAGSARTVIAGADWYYALLKPLCARVDVWRTTYYHPLAGGIDAVAEWLKGTGLRPYLDRLRAGEQEAFLAAYKQELAKSYKPLADGAVLLPFPRLFIVAVR